MNIGLTGVKVIIIDDEESEALPIIKALAKQGVSTAYFDGSIGQLPRRGNRLCGVRLAILDMDLTGGGVPDKSKASALIKVLERVISSDNGPYMVLAWTKHKELIDEFEGMLFRSNTIPAPVYTLMLEKSACKNPKGKFDLSIVSAKIEAELVNASPLQVLQAWEEKSISASTKLTNTLSDLSAEKGNDLKSWRNEWKTNLLQVMRVMVAAEMGQQLDINSAIAALYSVLNPLHADRMENGSAKLYARLDKSASEIIAATGGGGAERRAHVNAMLHLARENLETFAPGNIYRFSRTRRPSWVPSSAFLLEDLMQPINDPTRAREEQSRLSKACFPVLIEVNAACDHAQRNIRIARFISGLLVPEADSTKIKPKAEFIWKFGPVYLDKDRAMAAGQYSLYFSARHLISRDLEKMPPIRPVLRLRGQAFVDLQSWFAHRASRPGIVFVDGR